MKSISVDTLRGELSNAGLCNNTFSYDLEDRVNCHNNTLLSALDHHAPLITKTITKRLTVPSFNHEVKSAKTERRKAERKWRRTKLHSDFLKFKAKKNHATFVIRNARRNYYTNFIQEKSNYLSGPLKYSLSRTLT